jgi:CubicO group peptidase (beta-lactamase class C family)
MGFSRNRLGRLHDVMEGYVERGEVAGIVALLARGDETHVETIGAQDLSTGRAIARDTIFRIASMTKPIAAAAAMMLVEEGKLRLDEPVDRLLPELANRKVLRMIDGPLDDTVPANRPITLRDLLTFRLGIGAIMVPSGQYPIQKAINEAGLAPGPNVVSLTQDAWIARLASLPLLHQPGEKWMYHTGSDVLGVLIARATGMNLGDFLQERIFAPLGMKDTAFSVNAAQLGRLATCYRIDAASGRLAVYDEARGGNWSRPPAFQSAGGGLVSTADDFLAFGRMMLKRGRHGAGRILALPTVELMTMDHLTPAQKAASPFFPGFWDRTGWGFGLSVTTQRDALAPSPGSYGWMGGFGTSWWTDPHEDMVAVLLIQRMMTGPSDVVINADFATLAYQALDD